MRRLAAMLQEFREGDWVRHHSCPDLLRVVGTGTTIAVQFPNGKMRAFEPCELDKVPIGKAPLRNVQISDYTQHRRLRTAHWFAFLTCLVCLITLMLWMLIDAGL